MTDLQFDDLLKNSIKKYGDDYITVTDDLLAPHVFSERSEHKIRNILRSRVIFTPSLFTLLRKKRLAAAFTIIVLLSVTAAGAGAMSKIFGNFLTDVHEKYTTVTMDKTNYSLDSIEKIYEISYIPEGFELVDETDMFTFRVYKYKKNEEYFKFTQYLHSKYDVDVNTEGYEMSEIVINGYNGIEVIMDDSTYIALDYEDYILELAGIISEEETVKIAESIYISE